LWPMAAMAASIRASLVAISSFGPGIGVSVEQRTTPNGHGRPSCQQA
jgi:hypothetical protein